MRLLIVRHAASEQCDARRWPDDSKRPLTRQGVQRFIDVASVVGAMVPQVDALLSSRWVRAWQTAELLAGHAGWRAPRPEPTLETAPAQQIAGVLQGHAAHAAVAIVGHEPTLSELISRLLTGRDDALAIRLRKGSVVCLDLNGSAGDAELRWMLTPKMARRLTRQ